MTTGKPFQAIHYDLLLAQMLISGSIRDLAVRILEPRFFVDERVGGTPVQAIMFTIIRDHEKAHGGPPDAAILMAEFSVYLDKYFANPEKRQKAIEMSRDLFGLLRLADTRSEAKAREILRYMANVCVYKVAVEDAIKEYKETGAVAMLRDNILEVEAQQAVLSGGISVSGILDIEDDDMGARVSTHVPWLDARFGKGAGPSLGSVLSIIAPQGHGKCLGRDTLVRMYDGSVRAVQDIQNGDRLAAAGSSGFRLVSGVTSGRQPMYRVSSERFEPFTCNWEHILTLKNIATDEITDISVGDFLALRPTQQSNYRLVRMAAGYAAKSIPIDPYLVGICLVRKVDAESVLVRGERVAQQVAEIAIAEGMRVEVVDEGEWHRVTARKPALRSGEVSTEWPLFGRARRIGGGSAPRIPKRYLHGSICQRWRLLLGILDGCATVERAWLNVPCCSDDFFKDLKELALSLGIEVYNHLKVQRTRRFHMARLSGAALAQAPFLREDLALPVRERTRHITGTSRFSIESIGMGDYYGFCLDGDGRFLLRDFTVTHNTTLGIQLAVAQAVVERHALLVLAEEGISPQVRAKIFGCALGIDWTVIERSTKPKFGEKVMEAAEACGVGRDLVVQKVQRVQTYLHVLDLVKRNAVADAADILDGELSVLRSRGMEPTYVYVDWAGIICDAIANRTGKTKREELHTFSYRLSALAQRHNNIIAVSHQMAPDKAQRGPFALNDQYCGAECKGFTEPHKYVFVLNPRDPATSYQILQVPKSRNDKPPERAVMQLRGDLTRFDDMSKQFKIQGTKIIKKRSEGEEHKLPVERR